MATLPMFPLGSVLLPGMVLPLHVFEDRYLRLVSDVLDGRRREFGVTLITRGSEVGGGDLRSWSGCAAEVLEAARTEDGRWALVCAGTRRLRVTRWLEDDPYPRAEVEDWPDDDAGGAADDLVPRLDALATRVRRLGALASELGAPALPPDLTFSDEPRLWSYQLAVVSPLGPLDRQRVLDAPGATERVEELERLVGEQEELAEARLALGDPEGGDGTGFGGVGR